MADVRTMTKEDNVFATLVSRGKTLKSIVGRNFSELNEIVQLMCLNCGDFHGLAQLNVRNQSQGWSISMLLNINNKAKRHIEAEPQRDGLQYRLSF